MQYWLKTSNASSHWELCELKSSSIKITPSNKQDTNLRSASGRCVKSTHIFPDINGSSSLSSYVGSTRPRQFSDRRVRIVNRFERTSSSFDICRLRWRFPEAQARRPFYCKQEERSVTAMQVKYRCEGAVNGTSHETLLLEAALAQTLWKFSLQLSITV